MTQNDINKRRSCIMSSLKSHEITSKSKSLAVSVGLLLCLICDWGGYVGKPMSSVGMSAASAIDALVPTLCPHRTVAHVRCLEIELWLENAWWQYNSFSEALGKIVFELLVFGRVWFVAAICNFHMFPKFSSDMLPSGLWTLMWYVVLDCFLSPPSTALHCSTSGSSVESFPTSWVNRVEVERSWTVKPSDLERPWRTLPTVFSFQRQLATLYWAEAGVMSLR